MGPVSSGSKIIPISMRSSIYTPYVNIYAKILALELFSSTASKADVSTVSDIINLLKGTFPFPPSAICDHSLRHATNVSSIK